MDRLIRSSRPGKGVINLRDVPENLFLVVCLGIYQKWFSSVRPFPIIITIKSVVCAINDAAAENIGGLLVGELIRLIPKSLKR